jgi:hypothetical protein
VEKRKKANIKKITSITLSILHWERMIQWASERAQHHTPSRDVMVTNLGEDWSGQFCSICEEYIDHTNIHQCHKCPLTRKYGDKGTCDADGSFWDRVDTAETWAEWVENAKEMLEALKNLRPRERRK